MNFFEIFNKKEYLDTKIIKKEEMTYSIKEILELIKPLVYRLKTDTRKNVLILSEKNFDFLINFLAAVFAKKEIYLLSDPKKLSLIDFEYILLNEPEKDNAVTTQLEEVDPDNIFVNIFTSGSSGKPKRIKKTLRNIFTEAEDVHEEYKKYLTLAQTEVVTSTSPHHMFGLTCYVIWPLYLCDKFLINTTEIVYPDSADIADKIFISTPSFLEKFKQHDVNINKAPALILTAGDKLKKEIFEYFEQNNIKLSEIYGSSEVGVIGHRDKFDRAFCCFKNVTVSPDAASQIVIKSPYFIEKEMSLCDIIEKVGDNEFILKNRSDRIIKIQEKRLNAMEIEEYINTSEYIESSYCFKSGEKIACAAVLNNKGKNFYIDSEGGHTQLIKHLKSIVRTKSEIIPQKWKFLYEIPKSKTGKINKEKIEALFEKNLSLPLILEIKKTDNNVSIKMIFSKNCNFFKGHFDGFPILPGVVQFYFAHFYAEEMFDIIVQQSPVKKVKFSHIIKPDEIIDLTLEKSEKNLNYSYKKGEQICSSGTFTIQEHV